MNEQTLRDFEKWARQFDSAYDLSKTAATRTENPYSSSATWKAYEAWCAAKVKYAEAFL